MVGQNLPQHIEFIPVLALDGGEGASRCFTNTHQVAALVDIHVMAVIEGVLIQPPPIFTFRIDDKGKGCDIKGECAASWTRIQDAGIFIFFAMPVELCTLRGKGVGIHQIKTIFKTRCYFNHFCLLQIRY